MTRRTSRRPRSAPRTTRRGSTDGSPDASLWLTYLSGNHTGEDVPIFAYGPGAEELEGSIDNTDLFDIVGEALRPHKLSRVPTDLAVRRRGRLVAAATVGGLAACAWPGGTCDEASRDPAAVARTPARPHARDGGARAGGARRRDPSRVRWCR